MKLRAFKEDHKPSEVISANYELINIDEGVNFRYYVGEWGSTPNYLKLNPDSTGIINNFSLDEIKTNENHYALLMFAEFNLENNGEYIFYSGSNDGTKLFIDSKLIIDNDGGHGYTEKSGKVFLAKGRHLIEVRYFQMGGGQELNISWEGPGFGKRLMDKMDFQEKVIESGKKKTTLGKTLNNEPLGLDHKNNYPHPLKNPKSYLMLSGNWVPKDIHKIDFNRLPRLKSQHSVVSDVRKNDGVNQHNYLAHYKGKFWIMWSDGPGVEDRVGQRVTLELYKFKQCHS